MNARFRRLSGFALLLVLGACGGEAADQEAAAGQAAATDAVMVIPVTSSEPAATQHFMLGQRDLDMGRGDRAREHFASAVEADGSMAFAHLRAAQIANSFADYRAHLEAAEAAAAGASEAERLLIQIERHQFDGDPGAALAAAQQLVTVVPGSPRAWMVLAGVQNGLNQVEEARASMQRAIQAAPGFPNPHMALANSLMLSQPMDLAAAEQHARHAVERAPNEALPQDILGDVHRAAGDLAASQAAYQRAAELAQTDAQTASAVQQLAHVNSFMGSYEEARANYDRAIAQAPGNAKATFGQWRAFVNLHAGDPQGAIDELNALVDAIDGMGIPEPTGVKIGTLTQIAIIGYHAGLVPQAEAALARRTELMRQQSQEVGTDEFRRGQEANIAFYDGLMAVKKGQHDVANAKAREIMQLREPDDDPRKDEAAHDLMGAVSLAQGDYEAALQHLGMGNQNNVYNQYQRARAHEGLGHTAEATALYERIANNRFNSVMTAMLRGTALEKTGGESTG